MKSAVIAHLHFYLRIDTQAVDLQSAVQNDPTIGLSVVLQLTGPHGSHNFDKLTKTKTVESILASMQADGIQSYIEHLLEQVNESSDDQYVCTDFPMLTVRKRRIH